MNDKDRDQLKGFFDLDKQIYSDVVFLLVETLSKQLDFKVKIQKSSIQLLHTHPFAAIGFRRSKDYMFIEFYCHSVIDNSRIIKTNLLGNAMIIHTVKLSSNSIIDDTIVNWIKDSYELTLKIKKNVA